ncbi:enoyl-CoA hydratase-related protein [Altererythrobacter sp.]|uniref:enoyl-CoA hydratase-related protein n=1 Tax=Altererythrobacter sp. TaxID=1872480 RepID=UPI001B085464|nr:enoyl-CoA hydratase-related protein [Altererythrobacter sp.]MBO6609643.1 enoyl-CoA hydratase/isomerase family protein [Altererythrobacter sp.]MBO6641207.1 enoyl-CoA hydratase/isomerase family protein [Altererythrobacter sp.]MBO6708095.1 enoyl-CoA hydratase/isomerase family protein [Altererythrobacter sp.]MBO6945771.1 enoyl-CoA hydratase/isomerase family protein [Altererythrobacter sp.]
MSYEKIRVEQDGPVTKIILNQPEKLNACAPDMADEIREALASTRDARCFLITGEGRAFCSGADLSGGPRDRTTSGGRGSYDALSKHYNPLMMEMARCDAPIVTAVNGPAAGVGCSIALAGDFAIAGKGAYFLQAFVNIGLVPDGGASWMLPRLIGKARATEMMMLGEKIPAEKAEGWGMIYKAVDDDALAGEAMALATRLANGPTVALGQMRENLIKALQTDYSAALHQEAVGQWRAGDSDDSREGIMAFLQKRKAEFKGK